MCTWPGCRTCRSTRHPTASSPSSPLVTFPVARRSAFHDFRSNVRPSPARVDGIVGSAACVSSRRLRGPRGGPLYLAESLRSTGNLTGEQQVHHLIEALPLRGRPADLLPEFIDAQREPEVGRSIGE